MPYIGQEPVAGNFVLLDAITTSATATYALTKNSVAYSPESSRNMIVSLNGVTQAPEAAYTVSGSNITFSSALTASDVIDYILVLGDVLDIGRPSDGVVGTDQMNYPLGNFSSTGIDDNATSTAITIDSSENVVLGNTSTSFDFEIYRSGAPSQLAITGGNASVSDLLMGDTDDNNIQRIRSDHSDNSMQFQVNNSERMRIDSSGNLLVGKDVANSSVAGVQLLPEGDVGVTRDGSHALLLNRLTSDGDIALFRKDGTTVGSIGTAGGQVYLDGASGDIGLFMGTNNLYPRKSAALADNAVDIGQSSYRFKDLYLSGDIAHKDAANNARLLYDKSENLLGNQGTNGSFYSIYLGGTAAANQIDDYEEGTWTPTNAGNITINTINNATYVKIGASVTINAWIAVNITSSSFIIGGLPYSMSGRTSAVVTNIDAVETVVNQALGTTIYGYGASTSGTNVGVFISLTYKIA